jgi:hypothetical protein
LREWAIRQGWGGRPVRQEQAQGILIAALGMLAAHVGMARPGGLLKYACAIWDDRFRIQKQRSAVATASDVRDP